MCSRRCGSHLLTRRHNLQARAPLRNGVGGLGGGAPRGLLREGDAQPPAVDFLGGGSRRLLLARRLELLHALQDLDDLRLGEGRRTTLPRPRDLQNRGRVEEGEPDLL